MYERIVLDAENALRKAFVTPLQAELSEMQKISENLDEKTKTKVHGNVAHLMQAMQEKELPLGDVKKKLLETRNVITQALAKQINQTSSEYGSLKDSVEDILTKRDIQRKSEGRILSTEEVTEKGLKNLQLRHDNPQTSNDQKEQYKNDIDRMKQFLEFAQIHNKPVSIKEKLRDDFSGRTDIAIKSLITASQDRWTRETIRTDAKLSNPERTKLISLLDVNLKKITETIDAQIQSTMKRLERTILLPKNDSTADIENTALKIQTLIERTQHQLREEVQNILTKSHPSKDAKAFAVIAKNSVSALDGEITSLEQRLGQPAHKELAAMGNQLQQRNNKQPAHVEKVELDDGFKPVMPKLG